MRLLKFSLLVCLLSLAASAGAQATKPETSVPQLLEGTWKFDSINFPDETVEQNGGESKEPKAVFRFFGDQQLLICEEGTYSIVHYELVSGGGKDYLMMRFDNRFYLIWIKSITPEHLCLRIIEPVWDSQWGDYFYSRHDEPMRPGVESMEGLYIRDSRGKLYSGFSTAGWSIYPPISIEYDTVLELNNNGQMSHTISGMDSGTWKLREDMCLELTGMNGTQVYEIHTLMSGKLILFPLSGATDSLYLQNMRPHPDPFEQEKSRIIDSIQKMDSLEAAQYLLDYIINQEPDMVGLWELSDKEPGRSTAAMLTLKPDGTVIWESGNKRYTGTWRDEETLLGKKLLILEWEGREQLAVVQISNTYPENLPELILQFVPPDAKEVKTMRFVEKQE